MGRVNKPSLAFALLNIKLTLCDISMDFLLLTFTIKNGGPEKVSEAENQWVQISLSSEPPLDIVTLALSYRVFTMDIFPSSMLLWCFLCDTGIVLQSIYYGHLSLFNVVVGVAYSER